MEPLRQVEQANAEEVSAKMTSNIEAIVKAIIETSKVDPSPIPEERVRGPKE